jgi:hypothetical protein
MPIELDHMIVPSRDKHASARQLAELLGVRWGDAPIGPFVAVYVNDGLTLAFDQWHEPVPTLHYCFRVSDGEFDAILARLRDAGIAYRSDVHGPDDFQVNTEHGGRIVYWNEPDSHRWEMLTVSYARAE